MAGWQYAVVQSVLGEITIQSGRLENITSALEQHLAGYRVGEGVDVTEEMIYVNMSTLGAVFNALGQDGWELVHAWTQDGILAGGVLKRPIQSDSGR